MKLIVFDNHLLTEYNKQFIVCKKGYIVELETINKEITWINND